MFETREAHKAELAGSLTITSSHRKPMAKGQAYRDKRPGADELHISVEALPCQKALHVHVQLMPQCNQGLVLGLQPSRSKPLSGMSGALPLPTPLTCRPPGDLPGDGLLGLLVGWRHEEAYRGHRSLARAAEHFPVGWLCRAH